MLKTIMTQPKWKSQIFWAAIAAQIISLGQLTGLFAKCGIDAGYVGNVIAGVLQLLVLFGIFNDAGNAENY